MTSAYLRFPHVHGDHVVFVTDDDLWLGPLAGGRAFRLTAGHVAPQTPRFSPSGQQIAFVSQRSGGKDLYVVSLDGQERRVTWLGRRTLRVAGWLDDETIVVASDHEAPQRGITHLHTVTLDGVMKRLPWGQAMAFSRNEDLLLLGSSFNTSPEDWKRYRGGSAHKIWIAKKPHQKWKRFLPEVTASLYSPFFFGDRVVFTSDLGAEGDKHNEQAQVWSAALDGSDLRAHTQHTFADGYVRDATTDGTTIVYHCRGQLYAMRGLDERPKVIEMQVALADPAPLDLSPTDRLQAVVPDHTGDGSVVEWRGTAWYITHRGGPARALSVEPGVRVREPVMLGDSGSAALASDLKGDDAIEIVRLDGDSEPRRILQGKVGRVLIMASDAKGQHLAVGSHDGTIYLVDVAKGTATTVGQSLDGEVINLIFSPDGRYLIWRECIGEEGMLGRLSGYDVKEKKAFVLTRGQFNDFSPCFSRDGKHLYFLSSRTIDPTYDEIQFDLVFTNTVRPWVIPLSAEEQPAFGPSADGWRISEEKKESDKNEGEESAPEPIAFDIDGAESRMIPLPVPSGRYNDLQTTPTGVLWRRLVDYTGALGVGRLPEDERKDTIEFFDLTKRKLTTIVDDCDSAVVSGDGLQLVVRNGDNIWVQASGARAEEDDKIHVDLSRLRHRINPRDEWHQMFDENLRLMRDHFWREDLGGKNLEAISAAYRPLVQLVHTQDELVDVLWEQVGEFNTSHAYVMPAGGGGSSRGWLGAELSRNAKGELVIESILEGESSDPDARSPLRAAGVGAIPGDVIVAIDGQPTSSAPDLGLLLQGSAHKVVELTLARGRMKRRVAVVPVASETPMRYHEWVRSCAAYVDKASKGRLGYVHIPDMGASGWAEFHRLIQVASQREGLVVDVRYNGGGHTSQLVIERLVRRVIGWNISRHYAKPEPYPSAGMRGPVVFVTNSHAGSDGDIVTAAAQNLQLGPVIGERSWGGVVGIDGRFDLVDGTMVTQPRYAFAFDKQGFTVENHGTDPDIEVPMLPSDYESDADPQLDAAVEEALRRLKKRPAATPPKLPKPQFPDA